MDIDCVEEKKNKPVIAVVKVLQQFHRLSILVDPLQMNQNLTVARSSGTPITILYL